MIGIRQTTREQAGLPADVRIAGVPETRASSDTALWCSRRTKTKILSKGVLMVYKMIQRMASMARLQTDELMVYAARNSSNAVISAAESARSTSKQTSTGDLSA